MIDSLLVTAGLLLLAPAALTGFLQARAKDPLSVARWRVVHSGGTAGAVQLLALAAIWQRFPSGWLSACIGVGVALSSWAFFIGPLARALGRERLAAAVNLCGALVAAPAYTALPLLLWLR